MLKYLTPKIRFSLKLGLFCSCKHLIKQKQTLLMVLNLETLRTGILGLTPEACAFYLQACTVCLVHSNHINGVNAILSET